MLEFIDLSSLYSHNWLVTNEPTRDGLDGVEWAHLLPTSKAKLALKELQKLHPNVPNNYTVLGCDQPKYFLADPKGAILYIDAETEQWLKLSDSLQDLNEKRQVLLDPPNDSLDYSFSQLHHRLAFCPENQIEAWLDHLREKELPDTSLLLFTDLLRRKTTSPSRAQALYAEYEFLNDFFSKQITSVNRQKFLSAWSTRSSH
ncbi:hypothetical protein D3H64_07410 [Atopobacter sp. AH10]|uniref:hypothetical protein n=1 Tax=Atopobacter sp. AH10 TaxID=2315861 RepID=UPI000EF196F9|nr:hypothetical protein [Atopobacter sp. AH10]RLK62898.1 hypothetical protein D3H64_07410 [Atopobacter sp. AH10]